MDPVALTASGPVAGLDVGGALRFAGIPYGAPTSGAGRFAPPRPPQPWTETRDARGFGDAAPQVRPVGSPMSEDCLVLNVWTPALDGAKRPVLVWLHGGGFLAGRGNEPTSDGTALARDHDAVVVSVNHRLGLLGFLDLAGAVGEEFAGSQNASLLDLVAALEWVRDNAASFGGDPGCVTIFGHSGGGGKVASLLVTPQAEGLFHRAAVFGGPPFGIKTRAESTESARLALAELGLDASTAASIREVPWERLVEVQAALGAGAEPGEHGTRFSPVTGSPEQPVDVVTAVAAGVGADIPLLIGTAVDEAHAAIFAKPRYLDPDWDLTSEQLRDAISPGLSRRDQADELARRYAGIRPDSTLGRIFLDIGSDQFLIRSLRLLEARLAGGGADSWVYSIDVAHDEFPGSYHGIEMPFVFSTLGAHEKLAVTPAREELARQTSAAFVAFARTGVPGAATPWPRYDLAERRQVVLGESGIREEADFRPEVRHAWAGIPVGIGTDPWTTLWS